MLLLWNATFSQFMLSSPPPTQSPTLQTFHIDFKLGVGLSAGHIQVN